MNWTVLAFVLAVPLVAGSFAACTAPRANVAATPEPALPPLIAPVEQVDSDALPALRGPADYPSIAPSIATRTDWDRLMIDLSFGPLFELLRGGTSLDPWPPLTDRQLNPRGLTLTPQEETALRAALAPLDEQVRRARITRELARYRAFHDRAARPPLLVPPAVGLTAADVEAGRLRAAEEEQQRLQQALGELRRAAGGAANLDFVSTIPWPPDGDRPATFDFGTQAATRARLGSAVHAITRSSYPEGFLASDHLDACKDRRRELVRRFFAGLQR